MYKQSNKEKREKSPNSRLETVKASEMKRCNNLWNKKWIYVGHHASEQHWHSEHTFNQLKEEKGFLLICKYCKKPNIQELEQNK